MMELQQATSFKPFMGKLIMFFEVARFAGKYGVAHIMTWLHLCTRNGNRVVKVKDILPIAFFKLLMTVVATKVLQSQFQPYLLSSQFTRKSQFAYPSAMLFSFTYFSTPRSLSIGSFSHLIVLKIVNAVLSVICPKVFFASLTICSLLFTVYLTIPMLILTNTGIVSLLIICLYLSVGCVRLSFEVPSSISYLRIKAFRSFLLTSTFSTHTTNTIFPLLLSMKKLKSSGKYATARAFTSFTRGIRGRGIRIHSLNCLSFSALCFLLSGRQGNPLFAPGSYSDARQHTDYTFFPMACKAEVEVR